jgi:hypothetical protein
VRNFKRVRKVSEGQKGGQKGVRNLFRLGPRQDNKLMTREITLTLPEPLAGEAEAAGLLKPEALELLLREEMRRRSIDRLFAAADRIVAREGMALTPEEVEAEIEAVRRERHAARSSGE